jgi:hypothetical protein
MASLIPFHAYPLCRERLDRILAVLARHMQGVAVRDFARTFSVWRWEIEQAEQLGFVQVITRKPHTGRPSRVVVKVSNCCAAKLPPWRWQLPKRRLVRHELFAFHSVGVSPANNVFGFRMTPDWHAYSRVYRYTSPASARACASRLRRHPEVNACRQWFFAQLAGELPVGEPMPDTSRGIWKRFRELGCWRSKFAPRTLSDVLCKIRAAKRQQGNITKL